MPLYDYDCMACGRRVEVFHGIHAPGPSSCEICGGVLRKAMSAPAIVFKGSGWAKLDARTASGGSRGSSDAVEKSQGDSDPAPSPATAEKAGGSGDKPSGAGDKAGGGDGDKAGGVGDKAGPSGGKAEGSRGKTGSADGSGRPGVKPDGRGPSRAADAASG